MDELPIPQEGQMLFKRFDQVKLLTTKNVSYLSAPPGATLQPSGIWSVAAAIDNDLLLTKDNIVIRIPANDVIVAIDYNITTITNKFGHLRNE